MKKILSTLMLTFSLSLFSGIVSAQENDSSGVIRVCYNTIMEVETKNGENKEENPKLKNNCFELKPGALELTNNKDKVFIYEIIHIEEMFNSSGLVYLLHVTIDGKYLQILVHSELQYVAIRNTKTNKTDWYFTTL